MSLNERIVEDMKSAMKQKDAARLSTLRMVKATLMNKKIESGGDLSDEETIKVLNTLVKQRRDSAEQYANAGRTELAEKETAEIAVIEEYLPAAASDAEIADAVSQCRRGNRRIVDEGHGRGHEGGDVPLGRKDGRRKSRQRSGEGEAFLKHSGAVIADGSARSSGLP